MITVVIIIVVTKIYILKRDSGELPFVYISVVSQAEASEKVLLLAWNRVFVRLELWSSWKTLSQRRPLVRPSVPNLIHQRRARQRSFDEGIARCLDFHSAIEKWASPEVRRAETSSPSSVSECGFIPAQWSEVQGLMCRDDQKVRCIAYLNLTMPEGSKRKSSAVLECKRHVQ